MANLTERYRDGGGWEDKAGYSRAVRRSQRIAVSGTTATASDGSALHSGDTYMQTKAAIEIALRSVEALGGVAEDIVRTRVYLAPEADWNAAARAHAELLGEVAPANTMLYIASLIGDGFLVEVEMEAELIS